MTRKEDNPVVSLISRLVAPFIMIFALYVIFHGHYSPGGGFQGGTMLAAAVLLIRLSAGSQYGELQFPKNWGTPLGSVGVLIYFGTGLAALMGGGQFLNYKFLPMSLADHMHRYWGTLFVEIGVGLAVMGILVAIYDDLLEGEPDA